MSPEVKAAFERVCRRLDVRGPVLEVGSLAGPDCLLNLPCLAGIGERVGVNLDPQASGDGIRMVVANSNRMDTFEDGTFGTVLCNSTLEHDPRFWLTLAEIRRLTASGGHVVYGVPGFRSMGLGSLLPGAGRPMRLLRWLARRSGSEALPASTATLGVHNFPGDYYRFTEQAVREVFLEGFDDLGTEFVMEPPRIIGWGRKP